MPLEQKIWSDYRECWIIEIFLNEISQFELGPLDYTECWIIEADYAGFTGLDAYRPIY